MTHNLFGTLREFEPCAGERGVYYSLPALEQAGLGKISRLPVSIRIVLEAVLRTCDGREVGEDHVRRLAAWRPREARTAEVPFVVSRIVLQDFTGVPLLCDLAAMRGAVAALGGDPGVIEALVPVDLVVDHSVQIDYYGGPEALRKNMEMEFLRNRERYQFLKWGMETFRTFRVIPPGIGIVHQVNLEYLARGLHRAGGLYYPDTLVGTDSHTTMINGMGVVGWGVGGIEAEAGMLGRPIYFLTPDVVGVNLTGRLREGVTATDLALTVTETLRREKVVGAFVEFFGDGASSLSVPDRATVANMAPEYGATMGFFPADTMTTRFLEDTGRMPEAEAFRAYFTAQGMFGMPQPGDIDYSRVVELDLTTIAPSVAGPRRPQDRLELPGLKDRFAGLYAGPAAEGGFGRKAGDLSKRFSTTDGVDVGSGDVIIAAITSCTNTSNPGVMLAAGLLAKKAVERGLTVARHIKTSLAPGSRVVMNYLSRAGLLPYLERLGFYVSAYGCTTCIGNGGALAADIEEVITGRDLVCAAVLSGNRNFEARIHPSLRANFLMSPPLVVAFAIAGTVLIDAERDPLGIGRDGRPVFLGDVWPTGDEIEGVMRHAVKPETFGRLYGDLAGSNPLWDGVVSAAGGLYGWPPSTYIAEPPFFRDFGMEPRPVGDIVGARALCIFGDSVTTDHISPAGAIGETSPAGRYLASCGVPKNDFQSYGTRRGNHEVMIRGTFANVRIRNLMIPAKADGTRVEGGLTLLQPYGEEMPVYDAAMAYRAAGTPTVVFAGEEYGTGSSRDWAAKGTQLLGVKAVVARSFERIHRSNLVGMGVLPLQFTDGDSAESLGISGREEFSVRGLDGLEPLGEAVLEVRRPGGAVLEVRLRVRIDTAMEVEYYKQGGILPYVLREIMMQRNVDVQ